MGSITKALEGLTGLIRMDSWVNAVLGLGGRRDPTSYGAYCALRVIPDPELRALFHTNDLAAKIVSKVVEDALRGGVDLGENEPLQAALDRFQALDRIGDADLWGRLYGGCALVFGVEGEDLSLPWPEVRKGSLRSLLAIDRRYISVRTRRADGAPETYYVTRHAGAMIVHADRMVLFGGAKTSEDVREENNGWDLSVLQRPYEVLRDAGVSWRALQVMITNASLGVFKINGLADMIASNKDLLMSRMEIVDMSKSVARSILIDAENEDFRFEGASNLTGVSDVWREIVQRLASAADMPATVLLGMSPAGMNATGESDIRLWYDRVDSHRTKIEPAVKRTIGIVAKSEGVVWDGTFEWPPLWQPSQADLDAHETAEAGVYKTYTEMGALLPAEVTAKKFAEDPAWSEIVSMEGREPDPGVQETDPSTTNGQAPEPDTHADVPNGAVVKDPATALNGAQISSLLEIVTSVAEGKLPRDSGVAMILAAFPLTPQQAEKIMGSVGKGFEPKEDPKPVQNGPFPSSNPNPPTSPQRTQEKGAPPDAPDKRGA